MAGSNVKTGMAEKKLSRMRISAEEEARETRRSSVSVDDKPGRLCYFASLGIWAAKNICKPSSRGPFKTGSWTIL